MDGFNGWNYSHINNPWSVPWASVRMQFTSLKTCPALLCTVLGDTRCVPWSGLGTSPYSYKLVEGSSQLCEAFHKAEVAASKAQEWSELRDCFRGLPFGHSLNLAWICGDTLSRNNMAKVACLRLKKRNTHLEGFAFRPTCFSWLSTTSHRWTSCCTLMEKTTISSR